MNRDGTFIILETLVLCAALMFVLLGTQPKSFGDTANSRLATVWSLAKHGTWRIDRPLDEPPNPFEQRTIDKVVVDGRMYSSKPPVLPLLMTAEYWVLHATLGWDLDDEEDINQIIRVMSITLVGAAYMAALVFFAKTTRMFVDDPSARLVMLVGVAFCTQLWGYSTNINNHVPGAGMLMVALYFALGISAGKLAPTAWRFMMFGLAAGLVATMELPTTVFAFLAGCRLLMKYPRKTMVWAGLGVMIPLAVHCSIMYATTGSFAPVQTRKDLYLYEFSYWRHPLFIDALNEPKLTYLFHMTFGRCGIFSLYPILLAGMAGALRALCRKNVPNRSAILTGALGFLLLTAYYAARTNNYGGEAYGFRWYIPAMPVLLLMGAPIFRSLRAKWRWGFVGLMIGISFYSAWECTVTPWIARHQWTCRFLGPSY